MLKGSWTAISYALQLSVVLILTISMLSSNPLDSTRKQWLVPNKILLTRLVDPLTQKIKWDAKSTLPQFTLVADQKNKDAKNLHEFVEKYTFTEDTSQKTFDEIAQNPLSPMTRAMLMMGCYGNLKEITAGRSLEPLTEQSNAVLFNILLNTWEIKSAQAPGNPQGPPVAPRNDRSVCSCMRDFAGPLVINYQKSAETPYTHDTCTIQKVVDYANATKENEDPLLFELNAYFKVFETRYFAITDNPEYNASTAWKNVNVSDAKNAYETFKLFMDLLEPNTQRFNTLGDLKTFLDTYVTTKMYSHNKLRTPKYNAAADLSKIPVEINAESYEVYMQKYRSAYQVCAVTGVPNYQTKPIMKIIASKYGRLGVAFLLAAAIFGFSTVFRRKIFENTQDIQEETDQKNTKLTFNVITAIFKVILFIVLIAFLWTISADSTDDKNVLEKENAVRLVIALLWVIWFVAGTLSITDSIYDFFANDEGNFESHHLVLKQIGQDVCIIAGLASLAVAFRLQRGDSDEYVFLACFSLFIVIGLLQHMSNLVRMMQQYVQEQLRKDYDTCVREQIDKKAKNDESDSSHITYRIAYNRLLITVIVAIGLVAYLTIATSTIQEWTPDIIYAEQHTRLFAFCAFFIFSAYDIFFEILVAVKYDQADLEQQHPRKMMWTSWTIVVSIIFLNIHQFFALCYGRQSMVDEGACRLHNYMFG